MHLFDMDGTLIDSNGIWRDVDEAFLARRHLPYTKEYYDGVAHTIFPLAAAFTKTYCHLDESTDAIMAEWMAMAGDLYDNVPIKPHVSEYLARCTARGERMAVLTSSVPAHCRAALTHLHLTPYFERVIFAQELGMDKKDPALYRKTAELLDVTPAECTVYDDSITACRSAKTAGMRVVGVYDDFFRPSWAEMQTLCDLCITDFSQL